MSAADELRKLDEALVLGPWHNDAPLHRNGVYSMLSDRSIGEFLQVSDAGRVCDLRNVLPEIIAVVKAAEWHAEHSPNGAWPTQAALDALNTKLEVASA